MHTRTYKQQQTYHSLTHRHTHTHACTHTHTHAHTYMHTHAHTHTPSASNRRAIPSSFSATSKVMLRLASGCAALSPIIDQVRSVQISDNYTITREHTMYLCLCMRALKASPSLQLVLKFSTHTPGYPAVFL